MVEPQRLQGAAAVETGDQPHGDGDAGHRAVTWLAVELQHVSVRLSDGDGDVPPRERRRQRHGDAVITREQASDVGLLAGAPSERHRDERRREKAAKVHGRTHRK